MVEKKENQTKNKVVKIKATTGAWWKSTTARSDSIEDSKPAVAAKKKVTKSKRTTKGSSTKVQPRTTKKPAGKRPARKTKTSVIEKTEKDNSQSAKRGKEETLDQAVSSVEISETAGEESKTQAKRKSQKPGGRKGKKNSSRKTSADVPESAVSPPSVDEAVESASVVAEKTLKKERVKKDKKVCKLLINAEEPEECRLALLEDGRLESFHVSTIGRTQTKNNIYKARIVAVEPSLQAAFVDYGTEKNGFLPFSEIHPEYYKENLSENVLRLVETHQWKKISIIDVIDKGQEILAQVVKEEIGKKGANMTTYLSLPGRCVVLMPGSDSSGVSRKISGEEKRRQLRDIMNTLALPEGIGWIVRTASIDITKAALSRDVSYLLKLWTDIKKKGQELDGVGQVYEDHQSVLRFLREHFDPSLEEILVDERDAFEQVKTFVELLPAQQKKKVKVRMHKGARPIFNQFSVEDQIESIYQPQVNLVSGGSIVIDPTEALVAIDVNSGSTSKGKNFEASIFQANMEAASELARQLRLRDLGGLIVVDFIDMRNKKHIMAVERQVKAAMKRDKAKVDFSRISKFGLMQISRQKLGAPIEAGNYRRCEHCKGRGTVRSVETLALYYLRRIQTGASRKPVERIECHLPLEVTLYLLNQKRGELHEMEDRHDVEIAIIAETAMKPAENELIFHKAEKEEKNQKQT